MTTIAYFQPFSGASGDMALGALLDAGLDLAQLETGLRTLGVGGWRFERGRELRGPFLATRLHVRLGTEAGTYEPKANGTAADAGSSGHHHEHHHHHHGEHSHEHHHHQHEHDPHGEHSHAHAHHGDPSATDERTLPAILRLIERSGLPPAVKASSSAVFRRLAGAEARVHGMEIDQVHFHEVGAVDSIVDIVGTCLGLHLLGIDRIVSAPITVGTGFVRGDHGTMPLPAPATSELLKGFPIEQRDTRAELTTPTGAALLTTLAERFGTMPPMTVRSIGYGAGDDRPGPVPNVLRVFVGESAAVPTAGDRVVVLETLLDDMTPEWLGHVMGRLFDAGALDATFTSVVMKKGRPGHAVTVICPLSAERAVIERLFRETTTFGIRRVESERVILEREFHPVTTPWGTVRVKIGRLGDEIVTTSPEFDDLQTICRVSGLPLRDAHRRVLEIYDRTRSGPETDR